MQEHAFEDSQKYKEGKFIIEKAKVMKASCIGKSEVLEAFRSVPAMCTDCWSSLVGCRRATGNRFVEVLLRILVLSTCVCACVSSVHYNLRTVHRLTAVAYRVLINIQAIPFCN